MHIHAGHEHASNLRMLLLKCIHILYHSILCANDYIKVYEGEDEGGILRSRVCGSFESFTVVSGAGNMLVRFHTDSIKQLQGFHATFKVSGEEGLDG